MDRYDRYALVIGIAEYDSPFLPQLSKTKTDAESVAEVLEQYGSYRVDLLTEGVTAEKLDQALYTLLLEQAVGKEALIYFTGHGIKGVTGASYREKPQGFLAASDCKVEQCHNQSIIRGGSVALNSLNSMIEESKLSSLVVFLDSCHSGELLERELLDNSLTTFISRTDYCLITACRGSGKAYAKKNEEHSVFTGALLAALSSNKAGDDGQITVDGLYKHIYSELSNSPQEPYLRMGLGSPIVLLRYHQFVKPRTSLDETCPYQGLRYFTDEKFFFGRRRVTETLRQKLEETAFLPIIGASGSGKSSVVRAGLISWLNKEGNWQILDPPIIPSIEPLTELKQAFKPIFDPEQLVQVYQEIDRGVEGLKSVISKLPTTKRFLLVVDQFEEVFTLCPEGKEKERDRFINLLTQVADIFPSNLVVAIAIRADFIENCLKYESLTKLIQEEAVYMPPLTEEALRDIIVKPAEMQGYSWEDRLVEVILDDIREESGCLPLLEFTLTELWQPATEQGHRLTLNQYQELGRVQGTLNHRAEEIYTAIGEKFGERGQEWVKQICLRLVRTGEGIKDTRQRQPKIELLRIAGSKQENVRVVGRVLERLIEGRLLVTPSPYSEKEQNQTSELETAWVDLSHEALIEGWERFGKWRDIDRELRKLIDRFKDAHREWLNHDKSDRYLLMGGLLDQIRKQWSQLTSYLKLSKSEKKYYTDSDTKDREIKTLSSRSGFSIEAIKQDFLDNLFYFQGVARAEATPYDYYVALAYTVRDRLLHHFLKTTATYNQKKVKLVSYLSGEFLMGCHLGNNLLNLGIYQKVQQIVEELGIDFEELLEQEPDPGLGSAGLGRLAACFLDSLASLEIPAIGYGIRYEFGIFHQIIKEGWQVEIPDNWLRFGNPWEQPRHDETLEVKLGGRTEIYQDEKGNSKVIWIPERTILAIPYDTPVPGYQTNTVNFLRLWKTEASESFDFEAFNRGSFDLAVAEKIDAETISKVLYPSDYTPAGRELRLAQQYLLASASIQDLIRRHLRTHDSLEDFYESVAIQLSEIHPALAIPELMRLLVDKYSYDWDKAWDITQKTFAYTNHTLLPEALERWPLDLFGRLLPRHLEIIYEINHRFLEDVRTWFPDGDVLLSRLSLIEESEEKQIRMANLACVGSHAINGISALHTELLKRDTLRDFAHLWPEKFSNKTNGVTPRRWILLSNPRLAALITEKIGDNWLKPLDELRRLEAFIDDPDFCQRWHEIKQANKQDLAAYILRHRNIKVDVNSLFDVQVKRIHEYKRQHLNLLHIITLYNRIKQNTALNIVPRTFIFGGKARPGYFMAKLIIKLINAVAEVINKDTDIQGRLKVVFLPNFNVSLGQRIYPAADLSEQISTAGKEASGTGNMKLAMNGALTIGTLDGANIEIREEVSQAYCDLDKWTRMSILNVARMGKFSSDRTIREYCQEIWRVEPVKIEIEPYS